MLTAMPARDPSDSRSLVKAMFMPIAVETQVREMLNSARMIQMLLTNGVSRITDDTSRQLAITRRRPPAATSLPAQGAVAEPPQQQGRAALRRHRARRRTRRCA